MAASAIVLLQVLSSLGLGILVLWLAGVRDRLSTGEQYTWSFAIGFGVLCWFLFFIGIGGALSGPVLLTALAVPVPAVALFRLRGTGDKAAAALRQTSRLVLAALILVILMDSLEIFAPVTDADSIAYHFDLPRRFWEAGKIFFVPRAIDGAAPLLVHMSYIAPYAFGGETGLNLWAAVTGVAAGLLLYTTCRRYLEPTWSFAVALVFLTTPAVLYGAGSGQVEVRLAMFAIVAAIAAGEGLRRNAAGFVAVAGLAVGFFAAGKYFGLMFALALGLALLCKRGFVARGAIYTAAVILAGFQWYWWNWLHTGDPIFPMLFPLLGDSATGYWSQANHDALLEWLSTVDRAVPASLAWFLAYPFAATLDGHPVFESGRTGLGPFVLLVLPFALAGAWYWRRKLRPGPLTTASVAVLVTYALWFFLASSQRVRYLLPIYAILLVIVSVAAVRFAERSRLARPLSAAFVVTILVQMAGQAVFTARYARFVLTDQDREAFRAEGVSRYAVVEWINSHIDSKATIMTPYREILFLLKPNVFQAHHTDQAIIDVLPNSSNPSRFIQQLREAGITHAIVNAVVPADNSARYNELLSAAIEADCFRVLGTVDSVSRGSRTLPTLSQQHETLRIAVRTDDTCPW